MSPLTYTVSLLRSLILDQAKARTSDTLCPDPLVELASVALLMVVGAVAAVLAGLHSLLVCLYLAFYGVHGLYLIACCIPRLVCSFVTAPWKAPVRPISPSGSLDTIVSCSSGSVLTFPSSIDTLTSTTSFGSLKSVGIAIDAWRSTTSTSTHKSHRPPPGTGACMHESATAYHPDSIAAQVQTLLVSLSQAELDVRTMRTSENIVEEAVVDYSAHWDDLEELVRQGKVSWVALECGSIVADAPTECDIACFRTGLRERSCKRSSCAQESRTDACV
ncbi:hypothetical protein L226DRAFT_534989 [Lentinus tigrinus ALCF2SS1-7]|uniref:Uncharacterized protein n=1 Tax=Lentinus tigrinus ALCF2SS1-6 TaxID=1328759 RepID=A0A5C2S870_9APHY|nr:hypothetical protein L227DRAFT_575581 [Lentinus tigrinus ALCF2SS1-6]RPD74762.1 hypothetical protein L226DRAFT_534989 [Lentinus tigrinus ALCF2SS1-7]